MLDKVFSGTIPELYDREMVPMFFAPYAEDIAARVAARQPRSVLEVAAGTGVVTRQLASVLPPGTPIVATDLNQPMLDRAIATGTARPVTWQQADVMQLPFESGRFDIVVCQFGAMFFPEKAAAFAEARRVLRSGGTFMFNVWDRIEENEFAHTVTSALGGMFPSDPPRFLARTPHGYHDLSAIRRHLTEAGFETTIAVATIAHRSHAASPRVPAVAYCEGTPLRNEIEERSSHGLAAATAAAAAAIERDFGAGPVDGKIQAHVISAVNAPGSRRATGARRDPPPPS
jgi:ubiquinone/menaquinone biosynthesis C-methylase UbiE